MHTETLWFKELLIFSSFLDYFDVLVVGTHLADLLQTQRGLRYRNLVDSPSCSKVSLCFALFLEIKPF